MLGYQIRADGLQKMKTEAKIYFDIKTENEQYNIAFFNANLSIKPTHFQQMFKKGKTPFCTTWEYSTKQLINPNCHEETEKLIRKLIPYKQEFLALKTSNIDIEMVLQIVIYLGDEQPVLGFGEEVITFVNDLDTTLDCDIYNSK